MKRITQKQIANKVGISAPYLNQILKGLKRPMWPIAKRLSENVPGSTPEQWLEAPPETLRKIIQSMNTTSPPLAGRAPANEQGSPTKPITVNP